MIRDHEERNFQLKDPLSLMFRMEAYRIRLDVMSHLRTQFLPLISNFLDPFRP